LSYDFNSKSKSDCLTLKKKSHEFCQAKRLLAFVSAHNGRNARFSHHLWMIPDITQAAGIA
jgi:hypothetical protein